MNIINTYPEDIQKIIEIYLFKNTNLDHDYKKNIHKILMSQLKMNFCYNCRRFFEYKKKKIINRKFVNSWDTILNNIMNDSCILERNNDLQKDKKINNLCLFENNIIINHWHMKDIKITQRNLSTKSKYIKLHALYNKYVNYNNINNIVHL